LTIIFVILARCSGVSFGPKFSSYFFRSRCAASNRFARRSPSSGDSSPKSRAIPFGGLGGPPLRDGCGPNAFISRSPNVAAQAQRAHRLPNESRARSRCCLSLPGSALDGSKSSGAREPQKSLCAFAPLRLCVDSSPPHRPNSQRQAIGHRGPSPGLGQQGRLGDLTQRRKGAKTQRTRRLPLELSWLGAEFSCGDCIDSRTLPAQARRPRACGSKREARPALPWSGHVRLTSHVQGVCTDLKIL